MNINQITPALTIALTAKNADHLEKVMEELLRRPSLEYLASYGESVVVNDSVTGTRLATVGRQCRLSMGAMEYCYPAISIYPDQVCLQMRVMDRLQFFVAGDDVDSHHFQMSIRLLDGQGKFLVRIYLQMTPRQLSDYAKTPRLIIEQTLLAAVNAGWVTDKDVYAGELVLRHGKWKVEMDRTLGDDVAPKLTDPELIRFLAPESFSMEQVEVWGVKYPFAFLETSGHNFIGSNLDGGDPEYYLLAKVVTDKADIDALLFSSIGTTIFLADADFAPIAAVKVVSKKIPHDHVNGQRQPERLLPELAVALLAHLSFDISKIALGDVRVETSDGTATDRFIFPHHRHGEHITRKFVSVQLNRH